MERCRAEIRYTELVARKREMRQRHYADGSKKSLCGITDSTKKQIRNERIGSVFGRSFSIGKEEFKPMGRTRIRPKICVQAVYSGDKDMQEMFIPLLVDEVRKIKTSLCTFEIVKDTGYNLSITEAKEAS